MGYSTHFKWFRSCTGAVSCGSPRADLACDTGVKYQRWVPLRTDQGWAPARYCIHQRFPFCRFHLPNRSITGPCAFLLSSPPPPIQLDRPIDSISASWIFLLQRKIYRSSTEIPIELHGAIDQETFEKARLYGLDKSVFGFWSGIYSQCEMTVKHLLQTNSPNFLFVENAHFMSEWRCRFNSSMIFFVSKLLLLLGGMPFLWRKSGELLQHLGYDEEHEVLCCDATYTLWASV